MIADCPHCFNRVYFPPTGICPACHTSVYSTEGADYEKVKFTIYESDLLPQHCYLCDKPTEQIATWNHVVVHTPPGKSFFGFFSLQRLLFSALAKAASYEERMMINLPQCEECSAKPQADHFDFEERKATFVVHKEFAERMKILRSQSK